MLEKFSQIDVKIGTLTFSVYTFKDAYTEFSQHLDQGDGSREPPLYGILWPAAKGLAWSIWQNHRQSLRGRKVLELGCGLALPSLLCARLGADVTAMDNHHNFESVLGHNLKANHLNCKKVTGDFADPQVKLGGFDWIIASDVLYEPESYEDLEKMILNHANPGGRVLIADPGRYAAENFGAALKKKTRYEKLHITIEETTSINLYSFTF